MDTQGIQIENVSVVFDTPAGKVTAVTGHQTSTVPHTSFVSIVGPSGCGKSTLLAVISGLQKATEGTVSVGGAAGHRAGPQDRRGVPGGLDAAVADRRGERRLRDGDDRHREGDPTSARQGGDRSRRPQRLREVLSLTAFRRHAAARRTGPDTGRAARGGADGRAVRRAGPADPAVPRRRGPPDLGQDASRPSCSSHTTSPRRYCCPNRFG